MLKNKIIVVTGGAGRLGQTFVNAIAQNGGIAIAADIDFNAAERIAADVAEDSIGSVVAAQLDITSKKSILDLIENLRAQYGHIDAVVNNAYPRNKKYGNNLENVTYEDFCENVDMHLGGYFLVAQQFCLAFKEQGEGNLINMSSIYGTLTPRFEVYANTEMTTPVEYAAIKSAVAQLTRYFAQYFKRDGIRVNSLSPGGIFHNQPASFLDAYSKHCGTKGMLDPQDIIGALVFLLSNGSRYMTGQNLIIDDGFSL
jgi:NAD(P)-dependent dehydrogenase (short-subunit alcohol dehydrogenase family)|tara:strand:- start:439 stop:1206 length:768 start_codon:yes stop_codon:yes gene_type:complete